MSDKQRETIPDLLEAFSSYNQKLTEIEKTQEALNDVVSFFRNEVDMTGGRLEEGKEEPEPSKEPEQNILRLELEAKRFAERLTKYLADLNYRLTALKEVKTRILGE